MTDLPPIPPGTGHRRCRCGVPCFECRLAAETRRSWFEAAPHPDGDYRVVEGAAEQLRCDSLAAARAAGETLFRAHYDHCPGRKAVARG